MAHGKLAQDGGAARVEAANRVVAVVDWAAPAWAPRIAKRLKEELELRLELSWEVVCLPPREAKAALAAKGGASGVAACLVVARADPDEVGRAAGFFRQEMAERRAHLILVDCRLVDLAALCKAVQELPSWPLAWMGRHESGAGVWDDLVAKVTGRMRAEMASMCEAGV